MNRLLKNSLGFTLIELLVVIAIIGILSTLAVLALGSARIKARDTKRMTDLSQIGKALDLYFDDNKSYPTIITPGQSLTSPDGSKIYLAKIPSNPVPRNDNGAPDQDYVYSVDDINNPKQYDLATSLGASVNGSGQGKISISGINGGGGSSFSCGQKIEDSDGNQYNTVQIGGQCWMKENLNVGSMTLGANNQANADTGNIQKYCYDDNSTNCNVYGGLYQWHTVMAFQQICDNHDNTSPCVPNSIHKGICPTGWHVPIFNEFQALVQFVDDDHVCELDCDEGACSCETAGGKLKATDSHLPIAWNGTNDFDFSVLPSGGQSANSEPGVFFYGLGDFANFRSASPSLGTPMAAWEVGFNGAVAVSGGNGGNRNNGYSIRCVKN